MIRWDHHTCRAPFESPEWATTDRGWAVPTGQESSVGNYLDYGPNHYRSGHEFCRPDDCRCPRREPGTVHAVYDGIAGARLGPCQASHYFETVHEAVMWIELNWLAEQAERAAAEARVAQEQAEAEARSDAYFARQGV